MIHKERKAINARGMITSLRLRCAMSVQQIDSAIDSVNAASSRVPLDARHHELAQRVAWLHCNDGVHRTAFAPLALLRASNTSQRLPAVYTPSLCVVVQGSKCARLGKQAFHYDAFNYLIVSVTLPVLGQILVASSERPYLCIRIDIDVREISRLLLDMEAVADVGGEPMQPALFVAQM